MLKNLTNSRLNLFKIRGFSTRKSFLENIWNIIKMHKIQKISMLSIFVNFVEKSEFCSCTTKTLIVVQP